MQFPSEIDRFKILKVLGKGAQGIVYLATDLRLNRLVAIKTLHIRIGLTREHFRYIIREARTLGKLLHPHCVIVYEAGVFEEMPYFVLEYVEGLSLRQLLKKGPLKISKAVILMTQILSGLAHAHSRGIIHRDLNPANVLISKEGVSKIVDFGISVMIGSQSGFGGTVFYMSPEHAVGTVTHQSDLFSAGLMFYEMITGRRAIDAEDQVAAIYKICNDPVPPPSQINPNIDPELDHIILKAVERDTSLRYQNASDMRKDLALYLKSLKKSTAHTSSPTQTHSTIDFLLRRMAFKKDFPILAGHMTEINAKASSTDSNYTSAAQLANVVLRDPILTSLLLRLANSAFYGQLARKVTTVSRAISVLGFEQVRLAVTSLVFFRRMSDMARNEDMKESVLRSFISGLIAKELSKRAGKASLEEVFICSMLYGLGKQLAIYYLPEEHDEIVKRTRENPAAEEKFSRLVLGISYEELTIGILRAWNFPARTLSSVKRLPQGKLKAPVCEEELLRLLVNFSNELCSVIGSPEEQMPANAAAFQTRYAGCLPLEKGFLPRLLTSVLGSVRKYGDLLKINPSHSFFIHRMGEFAGSFQEPSSHVLSEAAPSPPAPSRAPQPPPLVDKPSDARRGQEEIGVLINGIQEISNILMGDYELSELIMMVLETILRGMDFDRVLYCSLSAGEPLIKATVSFGEGSREIMESFAFEISPDASDVFNSAMSTGMDIVIQDADASYTRERLPDWYKSKVKSRCFVLYPLIRDRKPLGLIYADRKDPGQPLSENQRMAMDTLRNHLLYAISIPRAMR